MFYCTSFICFLDCAKATAEFLANIWPRKIYFLASFLFVTVKPVVKRPPKNRENKNLYDKLFCLFDLVPYVPRVFLG